MNDQPLRRTCKRIKVISGIEAICRKHDIPIQVDLNCYPKMMLDMALLRLQMGELL